jgi:hypothetical protein
MPPKKKTVVAPIQLAPIQPVEPEIKVEEATQTPLQPNPEKKTRAKRAPKASDKNVVAVVSSAGIQGSLAAPEPARKPLIVHLPIQSNSVRFYENIPCYDPAPPSDALAFNALNTNPFTEEGDVFDNTELVRQIVNSYQENEAPAEITPEPAPVNPKKEVISVQPQAQTQAPGQSREYGPTKLLIEYANTKTTHTLPECTESACFWCCEQFTTRPCVNPLSIVNGVWQVYGNFCNPNCALASLLAEPMDTHVRWERIALLHMLYSDDYKGGRIYPAPDRTVLQRFGGPVTPADFRALSERGRLRIDIHMPPLVSILASMDTKPIDFYESTLLQNNNGTSMIPQKESNVAADGGLKLKRSKPLKEKEHTLDNILGFRVAKRAT